MRLAPFLLLISINALCQSNQSLRFIQNKGQWNADTDFQAQVPGGRLGISATGFSILLLDMEEIEHRHLISHESVNESNGQSADEPINGHYFQINLLGSNKMAKAIVELPLDGHYNYFLGNDTSRWATNVLAFASILYQDVYKGIDFRVSSLGSNLKYDFIVKPGADPSQIKIEYTGVDGIDKSSDALKIKTAVGFLTEQKPYSYQASDDKRQTVPSKYQLSNNIVSFSFPDNYDPSRELVIDPLLIFSTYSGSTADNWGSTATPGEHGTLYSAGVTHQNLGGSFPATLGSFQTTNHGSFDMAIIKYDSAGTRFLYATHLGGSGNDSPQSLVVDKTSGDLIVLGISSSLNYPTGDNSFDRTFNFGTTIFNRVLDTDDQWDIVLTRLSSSGDHLVGSTFLGGSGNDGLNLPKQSGGPLVVNYGDEMRGDVITDDTGHVYISSVTSSNDFPIINGLDNSFNEGTTDGLVVKLAPDLSSIVWSSYVGGSGFDAAYSIKFDNKNNLVLAGGTTSLDFPVTAGAYQSVFNGAVDGWIARITADGSAVMNATFTGTSLFDQVYFVDLNANGDIFCYGQTTGQMPITSGVFKNVNSGQFVQKFSPDLTTLAFSTVFGSASSSGLVIPNISPTAFLVNDCDNIYMAGWGGFVNSSVSTGFWQSSTNGMPITNDAFQKTTSGSDFYFIVLNGDATKLVYSTYFGGNSSKTHVDGGTSRFDKFGIVYHAVCSGCQFGNATGSSTSDFPTTARAKSRFNGSTNCNNAAFKFDLSSLRAMFDTNNLALTMPGFNDVCYPDTIVFQNLSTGGKTIVWDFDDGTIVNKKDTDPKNIIHQYKNAGEYRVKLKITDLSTCSQRDSITKVIRYYKPIITVGDDASVCDGNNFQLTANGGVGASYSWSSKDGTFTSSEQSPSVQPTNATTYYVTVVDANGCSKTDTLNLSITPYVHAAFQTYDLNFSKSDYNNVCYPNAIRFKNLSTNGESFIWNFDDGIIVNKVKSDTASVIHNFSQQRDYNVKLKALNPNTCNKADSITKVIRYLKPNITVGDDASVCDGNNFQLTANGGVGASYSWSSKDGTFTSSEQSPSVQPARATTYYVTVVDANGCSKTDTLNLGIIPYVHAAFQTYDLNFSKSDYNNVCFPNAIRFKNLSSNGESFIWNFDDGIVVNKVKSDTASIIHEFPQQRDYKVKLKALNPNTCNKADSVTKTIRYFKDQIEVGDDGEICEGASFQLTANGGSVYAWSTEDQTFSSSNPLPIVQPAQTTEYFVTVTDAHGCVRNDTIQVSVVNKVELKWKHYYEGNCVGRPSVVVQNLTPPSDDITFFFDFGDGTTSTDIQTEHAYEEDGLYSLKLVSQKKLCPSEETVQLPIYKLLVPNVFTPDGTPGYNDNLEIRFGADEIAPADVGFKLRLLVVDRWGKTVFESTDYKNDWNGQGVQGGVYFIHLTVEDVATCKSWVHIVK
jgi:PKD repeat protein